MSEVATAGEEGGGTTSPPSCSSPLEVLRTIPLLNAMVDVALVLGYDETCTEVTEDEKEEEDLDMDAIAHRDLKLHFLQIVTPGQVYPERSTNDGCCTSSYNGCDPPSQDEMGSSPVPPGGQHQKKFSVEEFGLTWEMIETMHFFIYPEQGMPTPTLLLPHMCHSERPRIYSNVDDFTPTVIPMLFTNILGERSFASVLRFARPFFISKPKGSCHYCLTPYSSDTVLSPQCSDVERRLVYLPTSLVLWSKRPCFQFMKDSLSGFHSNLVNECEDMKFWEAVQMFCERIFLIPAPPPGCLSLEFQLPGFQSNLIIRPPRGGVSGISVSGLNQTPLHADQYLDIRFNYPFMCLSVDHVLQVVCALLTGRNVLFVSTLYPMLTYAVQLFLAYISPFVWRHSVVPILPYLLLEILDAPVATIIGIHSSFMSAPEFKRVENAVIVDLDNDSVSLTANNDGPLPPLPKSAMENFKTKYCSLQKQYFEVDAVQRLSPMSTTRRQLQREMFDRNMDDSLAKLFLELMVRLFHKVTKQLLHSRVKYEEAVRAMDTKDQEFYRHVEATDMFSAFYQSQRQGIQSDFNLLAIRLEREERRQNNDMEESIRPRTSLLQTTSYPGGGRRLSGQISGMRGDSIEESTAYRGSPISLYSYSSLSSQASSTALQLEPVNMELPPLGSEFRGREDFLDSMITTLSELQKNKMVEAQCVYLRGHYLLCKREVAQALVDHFDTLRRLEVTLVPQYKSLQSVINFLSPSELAGLSENSHFKALKNNRRMTFVRQQSHMAIDLDKTMPRKPLNHQDFQKLVHQNAIALDAESASNLHWILSQERTTVVHPETFRVFYQAWKLVLDENERVELPNMELGKAEKGHRLAERVLAVANYIRTNFGSQSTLVLTTYRLLAVTGFTTRVMANFSEAMRFENFSYATHYIGAKSPGIRIEMLDKQTKQTEKKKPQSCVLRSYANKSKEFALELYMAFQDNVDRDNWYHMLVEMRAGWEMSQRLKDHCVMEIAQGHVILQNAINQSGLMDQCNHAQRRKKALKMLSYQSKDVSEVSTITVEALQYRINPCLHEPDKQTVESLLYIPPFVEDEGEQGKLWIGLGNGRLKVYDIESKCFESDIKITESKSGRSVRLSCLLLVNQHVWVGSSCKNIHILDAETVCHVSQLSFLEDTPRDMTLSQNQLVWSLLLNGCVLAWDPNTRKQITKIQVPIDDGKRSTTCTCFTIWRDQIWVGTNKGSISVMDSQTGTRITELFFPRPNQQVEIKYLAISNEDEVWCSVYCIPRGEDSNFIAVFDPHTHEEKMQYSKLDNRVSVILPVNNAMWCGTKSGKIYIFHSRTYAAGEGMPKILSAHEDFIRTMTLTDIGLVVSGSGSNDGYAAVWKAIQI